MFEDEEIVEVYVTLTVRYREFGEDKTDIFSFHDHSPYFGTTNSIMEIFEPTEVLDIQTVHSAPPAPLPSPTHRIYPAYRH